MLFWAKHGWGFTYDIDRAGVFKAQQIFPYTTIGVWDGEGWISFGKLLEEGFETIAIPVNAIDKVCSKVNCAVVNEFYRTK